eukprot:3183708-Rhodomonas_salina.4
MRQGSRRGVLRTSISHGRDMTSLGGIAATRPRVTVEEGVPNTHRVDFEEISSAPSSGRKASEADSPGGGHSWNILHFPEPPPSSRGHEKRISGLFMPWDQKLKQEHDFSHRACLKQPCLNHMQNTDGRPHGRSFNCASGVGSGQPGDHAAKLLEQ